MRARLTSVMSFLSAFGELAIMAALTTTLATCVLHKRLHSATNADTSKPRKPVITL